MSDVKFVEGLRVYKPRDGAPDFVKANMVMNREELMAWLGDQPGDDIRIDIKESRGGKYYAAVNEYKPKQEAPQFKDDPVPDMGDCPF